MPGLDAGSLGLVAGAVPSPKDWLNSYSTLYTNYQNKKFSSDMYNRQFKDSVSFWNMQNEYNTPSAQVARFKDAGLNPALAYGQGSNGNAASIPTPDVQHVDNRAPQFEGGRADVMGLLLAQADLKIKGAQADNLTAQNEDIRQQGILRAYQAKRAGFDLSLEEELRDVSADARRVGLEKTKNDILLSQNRDAREAVQSASSVQEAAERMLSLRSQRATSAVERTRIAEDTQRLRLDNTLKQLDIDLRKQGINPNDPLWARIVGRILSDYFDKGSFSLPSVGDMLPSLEKGQKFPMGPKY